MPEIDPRYRRTLLPGQSCVVHVYDLDTGETRTVYRTSDLVLEAPNWTPSGRLILNGDGVLWQLDMTAGELTPIEAPGLPCLNNDHVLDPTSDGIFVSGFDWHVHHLSLATGAHRQITKDHPDGKLLHFLHGVTSDASEIAIVGIGRTVPASIFAVDVGTGNRRRLTHGDRPDDGPEYAPGDEWIYFNTEGFSAREGHAQIARMRRDGSGLERLTVDDRVHWFPHLAPVGSNACFLSYPFGTIGHPANVDVDIMLVSNGRWNAARSVARLFGGQGTINVNSWAPDGRAFAFVSYPTV